ncbi:hypothetical protein E4K10_19340 [Streptomyces sp. T1317-0309]|nr:hypothetical protein E4K10_19340 [Streptomyces sp. T1317-0309]
MERHDHDLSDPPGTVSAAQSRKSRYAALDFSLGTATVRPVRSVPPRGSAPAAAAAPQRASHEQGVLVEDVRQDGVHTFRTSNSPRSAMPLVMSMSAKVTSRPGHPVPGRAPGVEDEGVVGAGE